MQKTHTIEVDNRTYRRIAKHAAEHGVSTSLAVRDALNEYVDQWGDEEQVPGTRAKLIAFVVPV
jgi:negative regulator of replication initiation